MEKKIKKTVIASAHKPKFKTEDNNDIFPNVNSGYFTFLFLLHILVVSYSEHSFFSRKELLKRLRS